MSINRYRWDMVYAVGYSITKTNIPPRNITMAIDTSPAQLQSLSDCLLNVSGKTPLHERFRALFTLKAIKGPEAVRIISQGFKDESALLKHELAYVLGQIGESEAVPVLEEALIDKDGFQGDMVRHEVSLLDSSPSQIASSNICLVLIPPNLLFDSLLPTLASPPKH